MKMKVHSAVMFVVVGVWWCGVAVVMAAPADTSQLPAEHKSPTSTSAASSSVTPHPIEDILDAVLKSETMSAVDAAAASLTSAVGEAIDDLGDFVVDQVKDLPQTIQQVSERVSQAVNEGGERVVIVVKGLRGNLANHSATAGSTVVNSVDRVVTAANSSQTVASLQDLQKRVAVSLSRIFGSLFFNMDKIDSAMANSIRRISGSDNSNQPLSSSAPDHDNEIKVIT